MCGLFGAIGILGKEEKNALRNLAIIDILRGKHSTGMCVMDSKGVVSTFKRAVNGVDFQDFKQFDQLMVGTLNMFLGHNRYATQGEVNNVNAHPFEFDNIVGAHNGTLRNYSKLDGYTEFEVDSECLYNHINNNGIEDAYSKAHGAMALTWFQLDGAKLYMVRNSERPLSYTYTEDGKCMFWASEAWMLAAALGRNNIKHGEILQVKENTLYTFDVPIQASGINFKLEMPKVKKLKKPTPTVTAKAGSKSGAGHNYGKQLTTPLGTKYAKFSTFLNKSIEFFIWGEDTDSFKNKYYTASVVGEPEVTVRLYVFGNTKLAQRLTAKRDECNFKGLVKHIRWGTSDYYLIVDHRTIEEVPCKGNTTEKKSTEGVTETCLGIDGTLITEEEFYDLTKRGCEWCNAESSIEDNILWLEGGERGSHLCEACADEPEIVDWVKEANEGN